MLTWKRKTKLILLGTPEPDQMPVTNVEKWDIFNETANMMETNQQIVRLKDKQLWITIKSLLNFAFPNSNVHSTIPKGMTVKAMQSLVAELNRQKELKRTYRRRYKDLHTVATTTTNPSVKVQPLVVVTSNKTSMSPPILKTSLGQGKKIVGRGKNIKLVDKGKKHVTISTPCPVTSSTGGPSSKLRSKLCDKAKVTAAMIQELTEELQSIEQESLNDNLDSEVTYESDLEQEDSDDCLTDNEEQ